MTKRLAEIARVDVRDSLALLRCPTLYLAGKRDRLVSRGALDVIRSAMPSIAVETVDAPHLVVQRNPVDSALLIGNFIRSTM